MPLSVHDVLNLIDDPNQFFHVKFIKRTTGDLREMTCRKGVSKGVTGKGLKFDPTKKNLITVYDVNAPADDGRGGFRMINVDGLLEIKAHHRRWLFNDGVAEEVSE